MCGLFSGTGKIYCRQIKVGVWILPTTKQNPLVSLLDKKKQQSWSFVICFKSYHISILKKKISSETGLGLGGYHLQCFTEKLTDSVFNSIQSDKHGLKDHKFV